jgi:hypothetical protein
MKKFFVMVLLAALIVAPAFAKIPARVTSAFQSRYASAANVEWKHIMGDYKASFNMGGYRLQARFDRKGRWHGSEKMIGEDKLPATVKNSLVKSRYGQWEIKSSYEKYLPNEMPSYHIIAAKGELKRKSLVFDHRGQLMNG